METINGIQITNDFLKIAKLWFVWENDDRHLGRFYSMKNNTAKQALKKARKHFSGELHLKILTTHAETFEINQTTI